MPDVSRTTTEELERILEAPVETDADQDLRDEAAEELDVRDRERRHAAGEMGAL